MHLPVQVTARDRNRLHRLIDGAGADGLQLHPGPFAQNRGQCTRYRVGIALGQNLEDAARYDRFGRIFYHAMPR